MNLKTIKDSADAVANVVKLFEELDPTAKVLPHLERSLQLDRYSCGAQCMFMILRYYRKPCTIERVTKELQTGRDGTGLPKIKRVFRKHNLRYRIIAKAKIPDLRRAIDAGCPVLISTFDGEHWAVVYGYSSAHVYVCDPSLKNNFWCRILKQRFREQWDRWALVVKQ